MKNKTKSLYRGACSLIALLLTLCALTACFPLAPEADPDTPLYTEDTELGAGSKTFTFRVTADELSVLFTIHTDEQILGDALQAHGLVAGDESQHGLYVKRVNNILADYDVDGSWWCLYVDGAMAMSGVDTTEVQSGASYEFRKEK